MEPSSAVRADRKRLTIRLEHDLFERMDDHRGGVPVNYFVASAIEAALDNPKLLRRRKPAKSA